MSDLAENQEVGPALPPPAADEKPQFEGEVKEFRILNGFPQYEEGHVVDGRCQIFERIGWDDRVGPTYLAMGAENKELVLRVGKDELPVVKMEAAFLCRAEQANDWAKFSQVHSIFHHDGYTFLALYFRGGPTLQQCFDFAKGRFSHGSAGRLAEDILQIMATVHKMGYMMRSLYLDQFHFDAASRHLFMADISGLRKSTGAEDERVGWSWTGGPQFAPLSFHNEALPTDLFERDEYEAWFYLLVSLVKELPWAGQSLEEIKWTKIGALNGQLFDDLPGQYRQLYDLINAQPSDSPMSEEELERMRSLVKEIYQQVGGVADHEENFCFERDPTEDELPRFVAERMPVVEEREEEEEEAQEPKQTAS